MTDHSAACPLTVGIDIGGTNIRASVVDGAGEVLDTVQAPTPHSVPALDDALDLAVRELARRHPIGAVVRGSRGRDAPTAPGGAPPRATRPGRPVGYPRPFPENPRKAPGAHPWEHRVPVGRHSGGWAGAGPRVVVPGAVRWPRPVR